MWILFLLLFFSTRSEAQEVHVVAMVTATLTWQDNSNNEDGFSIERSCGGTQFAELARVTANVTTFADPLDSSLAGKTCLYRVAAYNTAGKSAFSNTVSYAVPQPPVSIPAAPSNAMVQ